MTPVDIPVWMKKSLWCLNPRQRTQAENGCWKQGKAFAMEEHWEDHEMLAWGDRGYKFHVFVYLGNSEWTFFKRLKVRTDFIKFCEWFYFSVFRKIRKIISQINSYRIDCYRWWGEVDYICKLQFKRPWY